MTALRIAVHDTISGHDPLRMFQASGKASLRQMAERRQHFMAYEVLRSCLMSRAPPAAVTAACRVWLMTG
jgi:hypothetical protein